MEIKLIVIRSGDPKRLADFYSLFGLSFVYHQHGNSPFHYSTDIDEMLLEIYPLTKNQEAADKNLRLGFSISDFDEVMNLLRSNDVTVISEPMDTEFGFMTIICDPDGRKIELYKKS